MGQWRYSYIADKLSAALGVAQRVHSLAIEENNSVPFAIRSWKKLADLELSCLGDFSQI
jgi:hypothetical protein